MGDRQWLVIKNLPQYGLINQADSLDLPPNAFTYCTGYGFYRGRVSKCNRFGAKSSVNTIFNGTTYSACELWQLYNSGVLKLKAGQFSEYENAAGTRYEIPCWLGMYATNATGVFTGNSLDAGWTTATFPRPANKWLTTNDKLFTAPLATPELGKNFTNLGGWKFTVSGVSTWPTAGAVYRDGSSQDYTVGYSDSSGGFVYAYGPTSPPASGTLTKQSGTGDASITYSARTDVVTLKTYADWTDSSEVILQADTTNPTGDPTADCAYNSTTTEGLAFNSGAIGHITNQFFTIRKIKLLAEGANASLIVRDNTTKRGYALQVVETATPGTCYKFAVFAGNWTIPPVKDDVYTRPNGTEFTVVGHTITNTGILYIYTEGTGAPVTVPGGYNTLRRKEGYSGGQPIYEISSSVVTTGPFTVSLRLWDGYFDSTDSAVGVNASIVWEKTDIYDWGYSTYNDVYYEDLWMWWRDNFITFGYGPNALGCVTTSSTPAAPRVGFALKNAYIAAASSGKYCIYSIDVAAGKTGPYVISGVAATTVTIASPPADGDYLIWGCKYANRKKIVPAADYVLFVTDNTSSANFPATIWRGGMMEEVPITNPTYDATFAYAANDIAIYKGRVFLAGAHKMILKSNASAGYSWAIGYNTPTLVKWSAPFKPDVWEDSYPSGTTGSDYYLTGHIDFAETNGSVNAIGQLRDVLVIYKSDAIAMLSPTGVALDPFQVDYMSWTIGVNSPQCIGITPLTHYFHSSGHLWQVEMGEITIVPLRVNTFTTDKIFMLPNEDTILFGISNTPASGCCRMIGYNWKYNASYMTYIPLEQISVKYGYVLGIDNAGKHTYTSETSTIITDAALYLHYDYTNYPDIIQTPMIDFGDSEHDKSVFTIDIYARSWSEPPVGSTPLPIYVKISSDRTSVASDWTEVTGKFITINGGDIYNNPSEGETYSNLYRYTGVFTGRAFQIAIKDYSAYAKNDFFRIVVEYETLGPTKK